MTLFIRHLSVFVAVTTILFLFGELLFRTLKIKSRISYTSVVRNILTAYVLLVTVYSLVKTHLVTINIVFVFLLACGWGELKRNKIRIDDLTASTKKFNPFLLLFGILITFGWSWFSIYNNDSIIHFNFFGDNVLYSKIARSISYTGFENGFYFLNDFDAFYHGPEPYHYFDLWGGSLVASSFQLNHYVSLQLVVYPLFTFLTFTAFCTLLNSRSVFFAAIIGTMLLFTGGLYLSIYQNFYFLGMLQNFSFVALTPWANKLSFFYPFFLSAFLLYRQNLIGLAILTLAALTITNIICLPVITIALISAMALEYVNRPAERSLWLRNILYMAVTALLIITFYIVFKRKSSGLAGVEITSPFKLFMDSMRHTHWVTQRNIIAGGLIHLFIFYFIWIPVIYVYFKLNDFHISESGRFIGKMIALTAGISLLGWAFLFRELNSFEVFIVVTVPLINTSLAILTLNLLNKIPEIRASQRSLMILSAVFVVTVVITQVINSLPGEKIRKSNQYSNEYLMGIESAIKAKSLKRGASIKDRSMLEEPHLKFNAVYPMGEYLTIMDESIAVVNMGDFNTPVDSTSGMNMDRSIKAMNSALFYRYVVDRTGGYPKNIAYWQAEFVHEYGIQFLILSRETELPDTLTENVDSILTDKNTGQQFITLR